MHEKMCASHMKWQPLCQYLSTEDLKTVCSVVIRCALDTAGDPLREERCPDWLRGGSWHRWVCHASPPLHRERLQLCTAPERWASQSLLVSSFIDLLSIIHWPNYWSHNILCDRTHWFQSYCMWPCPMVSELSQYIDSRVLYGQLATAHSILMSV